MILGVSRVILFTHTVARDNPLYDCDNCYCIDKSPWTICLDVFSVQVYGLLQWIFRLAGDHLQFWMRTLDLCS